MKLKAWMEMYLYRNRTKKSKKDKKNKSDAAPTKDITSDQYATSTRPKAFIVANEGCLTPQLELRTEDQINSNTIYESLDDLRCGHKSLVDGGGQSRLSQDYQTGSQVASSVDVRRTPSLGIRSRAVYSRGNSVNEKSETSGDFANIKNSLYSSLSNVPKAQTCLSPVTRSKIKTNPWYSTLRSSSVEAGSGSNYSTLSSSSKSFRSESTSSEFSAMEESSSCAETSTAPSSNSSTLDSEYRGPNSVKSGFNTKLREATTQHNSPKKDNTFETHNESGFKLTDSLKKIASFGNRKTAYKNPRDSGYLSQDSKYRSLTKDQKRAEEEQDTDDSGTLMEKEWSSPEVEICDIITPLKLSTSIEVDEAYSEVSSLPSESSPDDDRFPEFQKLSEKDLRNENEKQQWSEESTNPRTISEICGSLEEKVQRLRFERLLVEEKIKEAREEERLRCEEKMKFQKEMIVHRRQILLRTLQNIRFKLEDQGMRLQDAYNATLGMQLSVRRNNVPAMDACGSDTTVTRVYS